MRTLQICPSLGGAAVTKVASSRRSHQPVFRLTVDQIITNSLQLSFKNFHTISLIVITESMRNSLLTPNPRKSVLTVKFGQVLGELQTRAQLARVSSGS